MSVDSEVQTLSHLDGRNYSDALTFSKKLNVFPSTPTTKMVATAARTSPNWALAQFRAHYEDSAITKWDIFHYVYGILHHPDYRERYQANLKRDLPRLPYASDFRGFAKAGQRLAEIHLGYEECA